MHRCSTRRLMLFPSAVCAALLLAACGSDTKTAPAGPEGPAAEGPALASPAAPDEPYGESTPLTPEPLAITLPLTPGVYVMSGESCARPSNAGFRVFDGRGISGSATRNCRATVRASSGDVHQVDQSCIDTYSGQRTTTVQTLTIPDARSFTQTEDGEAASFRLCPAGEAPGYLKDLVSPE